MNWSIVRREWGAASFVLTVLIGLIVVPLALAFLNHNPTATVILPPDSPSPSIASSAATSGRTASPPAVSPVITPAPTPT